MRLIFKCLLALLAYMLLATPSASADARMPLSAPQQVEGSNPPATNSEPLQEKPIKIKLFGSSEIQSRRLKAFAKWAEMWRRHNLPQQDIPKPRRARPGQRPECKGINASTCAKAAWDGFITSQIDASLEDMLQAVNAYMNRSRYIVDPVNWGLPDYWETPDEFFLRNGDCEDYAISKYITLKRLGVDPDTMRLVILQDENLRVAHAVLAVRVGDEYMILDNQVNRVLSDTKIRHYRPVYSINESGWYLHHRRRFTTPRR